VIQVDVLVRDIHKTVTEVQAMRARERYQPGRERGFVRHVDTVFQQLRANTYTLLTRLDGKGRKI
jgi:hypothetical protein